MQWQHLPNNKTRNVSKLTNVGLALHRIMLNIETAGRLEITCDMESTGVSIRSIALAKKISILLWGKKSVYAQNTLNTLEIRHPQIIYPSWLAMVWN